MKKLTNIRLTPPYLIFIGDVSELTYVKTGAGLVYWQSERVAGQLRFEGNPLSLGVADMSVQQAVAAGVGSIVIGVAPIGGVIAERWIRVLEEAAAAGLDVVSGLHQRLEHFPGLVKAAAQSGASLINVREPPPELPIATGARRSGRRVLTVGTDCAVGKKYTALALTQSLCRRGLAATFRATGQTGIMIAGTGIPLDAVVADFVAGAAELVSPANEPDHWDIIEGQGSLFNASYAGVSLGLLHGSQPDAIVVCHDPARRFIGNCPAMVLPSIAECIELNLRCGGLTNPNIICAGISINTSTLAEHERGPYLQKLADEIGLPCVDPIADGCDSIAEYLDSHFQRAVETAEEPTCA